MEICHNVFQLEVGTALQVSHGGVISVNAVDLFRCEPEGFDYVFQPFIDGGFIFAEYFDISFIKSLGVDHIEGKLGLIFFYQTVNVLIARDEFFEYINDVVVTHSLEHIAEKSFILLGALVAFKHSVNFGDHFILMLFDDIVHCGLVKRFNDIIELFKVDKLLVVVIRQIVIKAFKHGCLFTLKLFHREVIE